MMVFYTQSTQHLQKALPFEQGKYIAKQFSDGEWYIKLESDVVNKEIWVIAATNAPADNLVQLFLLLDALQREGAKINLLFTYFGYARQDDPQKGEAASGALICKIVNLFKLNKVIIFHPHSNRLHEYLNFESVFPDALICAIAKNYDAIAAPDEGAHALVKRLSQVCKIEAVYLTKMRPEQETVKVLEYDGAVPAKRILIIDDMIATGKTVIEVAKKLKELGAQEVSVWATHGLFSANAYELIGNSDIARVYVTDSLIPKKQDEKIEVVSISPLIEKVIKQ